MYSACFLFICLFVRICIGRGSQFLVCSVILRIIADLACSKSDKNCGIIVVSMPVILPKSRKNISYVGVQT